MSASQHKTIIITEKFSHESYLFLKQNSFLKIIHLKNPEELTPEVLENAHALLIRSKTQITEKLLQGAKNLQLIITATSGFDHIDLAATERWGITVMHTPTANIESTAQLTWALALMCSHKLKTAQEALKKGQWDRSPFVGHEMAGRHYGIIGLGRIGSRVAELAKAFKMNVAAYDPYVDEDVFEKLGVQRFSLEELLKTSDIVSLHIPKTKETEMMFNRSVFEFVQRGIILINTSRGSAIDENDLVEALEKGYVGCVGLDVFQKEPLSLTSNLLRQPHCVFTPHIGANTEEAFFKASQLAAEKLLIFFNDGSTSDTLPPRVPWYGAVPFKS
ncbi:MAG TPA: NAD(P)-dependent oxidoreductase [Pseudobdellovibrionaceae bacterium]|nr:NAD(P)-dependent oxidoreductase [Pseudobdellovibrionaceae bacterium]